MRKKEKIKNRVSALLLSGVIVSGLIAPAFSFNARAEAIEVLNNTCTVADMVLSYCASSGFAVMNETVINEVYQELGSSFGTLQSFYNNGLLTYADGSFIDTGLSVNIQSAIENIESIDIGAMFNQTAEQNATGVALTGSATLAGISGSVATTGVLPLVAGVAIEGYCGFQLGTLIANYLGLYDKPNVIGVPLNTPSDLLNRIPDGSVVCSANYKNNYGNRTEWFTYVCANGVTFNYTGSEGNKYFGVYNNTGEACKGKTINVIGGRIVEPSPSTVGNNGMYCSNFSQEYNDIIYVGGANSFPDYSSAQQAFRNWANGTETPVGTYSPDVIGKDGNLTGTYSDNDGYTIPSVLPQIDPSTQSVNPSGLSLEDWLRFANDANHNSTEGNPDLNQDIFNDIVEAIRGLIPTPSPDPNPDPNPDPETYPVPGPVPDPSPVPDPDYQPETRPQPDFTEKQTENQTDITEGDPWTTPDLLDKFPFCIPKDIYRVFTKLDSKARSAPHIQWRFHPNNIIDHTFDIDFSQWDSIASLLRTLELLAFIVGLAIGTRKLIIGG